MTIVTSKHLHPSNLKQYNLNLNNKKDTNIPLTLGKLIDFFFGGNDNFRDSSVTIAWNNR